MLTSTLAVYYITIIKLYYKALNNKFDLQVDCRLVRCINVEPSDCQEDERFVRSNSVKGICCNLCAKIDKVRNTCIGYFEFILITKDNATVKDNLVIASKDTETDLKI